MIPAASVGIIGSKQVRAIFIIRMESEFAEFGTDQRVQAFQHEPLALARDKDSDNRLSSDESGPNTDGSVTEPSELGLGLGEGTDALPW